MGLGRSLQGDTQGKRFKLATRAARVSNGVNGNSAFIEKKERKSKKVEIVGNRAIGISYAGESKGTRKGLSGRRNVKTRNNGEPHETLAQGNKSFKSLNLDKKRKSSDAVLFTAEERVSGHNAGRFNRKSPPKMGQDMHRDNSYEARKTTKKNLHKLEQASQNRAIGISYAGESKWTRKGMSGRSNVKTRNNGEPHETLAQGSKSFKSLNLDKKRKSSDAVLFTAEERVSDHNAGRFNRKSPFKMGQDMHRDNSYEARKTTKKKLHKLEQASQNALLAGRKNSGQSEFLDKKKSGAHALTKSKKNEGVRNDKMNRSAQSKSVVTKQSEKEQIEVATVSVGRPSKKKVQDKKSTTDDSEGMDEPPKKKRRRIKIDPYDTSNKRLDDGIAIKDNVKKKEEDSRHGNAELSKNAQFRAIVPSPSILSFVEDNLLGRRREIEFRRAGYNIELSAPLDNIPHSSSSERERIEETVFRNKLTFFAAAKISSSFPPPELPEIAFAGRSNVGKSSLLNALTRQWGVVRTSDKPGLTQTINFFKLASKLCLVDLPGYGFAYAKEEVKEAWEELVKEYVSTRVGLKRVCLLVDTKWGMKPRDHELIDLMERLQTKYQIVLTKTDTVFPIDVARRAMQIEESLKEKKSAVQPVMMVSSKTGAGIRSLRTVLAKIARFVKP